MMVEYSDYMVPKVATLFLAALLLAATPAAGGRPTLEQADKLLTDGEFNRAGAVYTSLLRDQPSSTLLHLRLGASLVKSEQPRDAIVSIDPVITSEPSPEAYGLRAIARFRAGRFRDAASDRDRALADPSKASTLGHYADARLDASEGRYADALEAVDRALKGTRSSISSSVSTS